LKSNYNAAVISRVNSRYYWGTLNKTNSRKQSEVQSNFNSSVSLIGSGL